ncbi:zinc-finger domain-containing protein [Bacillus velezensis]
MTELQDEYCKDCFVKSISAKSLEKRTLILSVSTNARWGEAESLRQGADKSIKIKPQLLRFYFSNSSS